ncbi:NADase-type glycan-binding domain-containing protein [Streptomyces sp. YS-3]|uniref:NADase-type glycan-binding domain-containing protein n=1 Tax=Streptomyces sp. YS-3 TaxID=3381352 RepID=UPI003862B334
MTSQNCAECGTRAEPGQSFCDSCGAVLGWDRAGARTPRLPATADSAAARDSVMDHPAGGPPVTPRALPDAPPAGDHNAPSAGAPAPVERAPAPASGRDGEGPPSIPAARPPYDTGYDAGDNAPTVPMPPTPASAAAEDPADSADERARSLLVPVADPQTPGPAAPPPVAPVLPGRPDADRPQVRAPGHREDAGGPPCRWCATPNRPDRHFCGRCAMPLAEEAEQPTAHRPWWRRLLGRERDTPWAGERPPLRRMFDRIGTWVGVAVVVTGVVLAVLYVPDAVNATRDHFAKRAPVAPDGFRASRSYAGHQPQLAFDKRSNTWWGPGVSQSGQGQWIEVSFAEPTRLLDVVITPGVSARADKLGDSALPHRLKATVTTKDGRTTTRDITLDQGAGGQRRSFRVGDAVRVRLTVETAYATSGDKQVAIAEVEFFGRSSSNTL